LAKKKRRGGKRKYSLAAISGAAAALVPPIMQVISGDPVGGASRLAQGFTGFDPTTGQFNPAALMTGLVPLALGAGVAMLASKTGINRYLNLPFVKI
jgi:hypothetical protein